MSTSSTDGCNLYMSFLLIRTGSPFACRLYYDHIVTQAPTFLNGGLILKTSLVCSQLLRHKVVSTLHYSQVI